MKLRVTNVSVLGTGRYAVNFVEAMEELNRGGGPVPPAPAGYGGTTNSLTLNLSEDEARKYFPGDEYTITLKKA